MKVIIAVAGYGTRLLPLTASQPKALLPIKGMPILNYLIEKLDSVKAIDTIYVLSNNRFYTNFAWWQSNQKTSKKIDTR